MMRKMMGAGVLAFGLMASAAAAQTGSMATTAPAGPSFGVFGGATIPIGDLSDGAKTGFNVGGLVNFTIPPFPLGLRADVSYQRLNLKNGLDGNYSLFGGDLNALFTVPLEGTVTPYLTGGVGFYRITTDVTVTGLGSGSNSQNKFALNGGGGLQFNLSGISTFVEARYLYIFTDVTKTSMIPISVGITFHP